MFGLPILDIAIGLIFIYLLLALVCTAANELIAGFFHWRARSLRMGIRNLLDKYTEEFYRHPLIKALHENNRLPSYIPSRIFVQAFLDILAPREPNDSLKIEQILEAVNKKLAPGSDLFRTLIIFIDEARNELRPFQDSVEVWFNNAMDRVSAGYKRKTQWSTFVLAAMVTVVSNADTIRLAGVLSTHPATRDALVAQAQVYAKEADDERARKVTSPEERIANNITQLRQLGLPLGWVKTPRDSEEWFALLAGLLLTTLAVSLGAPFWFDILNKVINVRAAGRSPDEMAKRSEK